MSSFNIKEIKFNYVLINIYISTCRVNSIYGTEKKNLFNVTPTVDLLSLRRVSTSLPSLTEGSVVDLSPRDALVQTAIFDGTAKHTLQWLYDAPPCLRLASCGTLLSSNKYSLLSTTAVYVDQQMTDNSQLGKDVPGLLSSVLFLKNILLIAF